MYARRLISLNADIRATFLHDDCRIVYGQYCQYSAERDLNNLECHMNQTPGVQGAPIFFEQTLAAPPFGNDLEATLALYGHNIAPMKDEPPAQRITVAIVEDDPRIRKSLMTILEQDEALECVGAFSTAEEAILKMPALKPKVILMDVMLPGMNGVSCVKELGGKMSGSNIIMLTAREDAEVLFDSLAAGANGYLLKPPRAAELLAAVHDVFAGGAPMTSSIARKVVQHFKREEPTSKDVDKLSPREIEVLDLLAKGLAYKEAAAQLGISYSTVHRHVENIYRKLHVHSCTQAVAKYLGS